MIPPAATLSIPSILHGCLAHAAIATWLRQPCSKDPVRVVRQGVKRCLWPVRRSIAPAR